MPINFDSALGIHDKALVLRARRAEMLASNIANADTPGYKARDIDFRATLAQVSSQQGGTKLKTTHTGHQQASGTVGDAELLYRIPNQASLDGNTVDAQIEKSEFAKNALRYEASLTFLNRKLKGMAAAFKGE